MERINIAVFSFDRPESSCAYIRIVSPFESAKNKVNYTWGVSFQKNFLYKRKVIHGGYLDFADLIIVQRTFPQKRTAAVLERIIDSGKPVVYDLDDLLVDLPQEHVQKVFIDKCLPFIIKFMERVDAVSVSTPFLAEALRSYHDRVHVLPNLIDDALWRGKPRQNRDKVVIGFGGTLTHGGDITLVEEALLAIADKYREAVAFKFFGCVTERLGSLPCVEYIDFKSSYVEYAQTLQQAGIDIAIIPLEDNHFNRCKSNIKWLEYSMCGIPGVYADLPPYNSCVEKGKTGLLAGTSAREWFEAIELLIVKPELRQAIGAAARQEVLADFSLGNRAHIYADFYRSIVQEKHQANAGKLPGWSPVKQILGFFRRSPFAR
jgi:glycosyltransferase involved in cell wall biosynthesis